MLLSNNILQGIDLKDVRSRSNALFFKKKKELDQWKEVFSLCPVFRQTLDDLSESSYRLTPTLWVLSILAAASTISQGLYRGFKDSNLNLYITAVGDTGIGKDSARRYFKTMFSEIGCEKLLCGDDIRSNKGIEDALIASPTLHYSVDEMGILLSVIANDKATYLKKMQSLLTSAFSSNEFIIAAGGQNKEKTEVKNMNIVISGVAAKSTLLDGITVDSLKSGQLNRFIFAEENDSAENRLAVRNVGTVSPEIAALWREVKENVDMITFTGEGKRLVKFSQSDVAHFLEKQSTVEYYIFQLKKEGYETADVFTRSAELAMRLACVVAVLEDPKNPVFSCDFFDVMLQFVLNGGELIADIALKNKSKKAITKVQEAKNSLYEAVLSTVKEYKGAMIGLSPSRVKKKIDKAPKKYGIDPKSYTNADVARIFDDILRGESGFYLKTEEGVVKNSLCYSHTKELVDDDTINHACLEDADFASFASQNIANQGKIAVKAPAFEGDVSPFLERTSLNLSKKINHFH